MKFKSIRMLCNASAYAIEAFNAVGEKESREIHLDYTQDARAQLATYDDAEVARIRPIVTEWHGEQVYTLEVELNV